MAGIYETIMQLPLFQGVSTEKVSALVEKAHFEFLKYEDGEKIVEVGEVCNKVRFVISGSVRITNGFTYRNISVTHVIDAPNVLCIDHLFGANTTAPCTITSYGTCGIMQFDKLEYLDILRTDKLFIINVLNILSRNSQKAIRGSIALHNGNVAERIAMYISILTEHRSRNIELRFRQKDLCQVLGIQRPTLVNALEQLQEEGIITFSPTSIFVSNRKMLLKKLTSTE